MKNTKKYLKTAVALWIMTATLSVQAAERTSTLEDMQDKAIQYYQVNEKEATYERGWKKQLEDVKHLERNLEDAIKYDDKLIKFRKYLLHDQYAEMRNDLDMREAIDFLMMKQYIKMEEYILLKGTQQEHRAYKYYNDDNILREYYEFQLLFLPRSYIPDEDRINYIERRDHSGETIQTVIHQQKTQLLAEKEQIKMDVYKAYIDLIMAQKIAVNGKSNLEESKALVSRYQLLLDKGKISTNTYKEAQIEQQIKQNEYTKALAEVAKAEAVLKEQVGIQDATPIHVADLKLDDPKALHMNKLYERFEKENITLFMIQETKVKPAQRRFEIAQKEINPQKKLYAELEQEKRLAELEMDQYKQKMRSAIMQQVRGIRDIQRNIKNLERTIKTQEINIALLKVQLQAGYITELEVVKLENIYRTLQTNVQNLQYIEQMQWMQLDYTIQYR